MTDCNPKTFSIIFLGVAENYCVFNLKGIPKVYDQIGNNQKCNQFSSWLCIFILLWITTASEAIHDHWCLNQNLYQLKERENLIHILRDAFISPRDLIPDIWSPTNNPVCIWPLSRNQRLSTRREMAPKSHLTPLWWLITVKFDPGTIWSQGNLIPGEFDPSEIWSQGNLIPGKFDPERQLFFDKRPGMKISLVRKSYR